MCLILFSYDTHPVYRLVLAANRDEFYDRPTLPLAFWEDAPYLLAGKDLKMNGTWLGVTRTGRLAAVTNFRDPSSQKPSAPSRGLLVRDFLMEKASPQSYLDHIQTIGHRYNGFSLLLGDSQDLYYYSNQSDRIRKITPGLYGLSNHLMDTPWPKVEKGKADLKRALAAKEEIAIEDIFRMLKDRSHPPDNQLPDTGVGRDWERILSSLFITSKGYGTRSSSALLIQKTGWITFAERTFDPEGKDDPEAREFRFKLK